MRIPFQIFANLLYAVAERAVDLNDPQLNALMCKLTLYSLADPHSEDFDQEKYEAAMQQAREAADSGNNPRSWNEDQRDAVARVLEDIAANGLPGPRDLDVALDAIQSTTFENYKAESCLKESSGQ